MNKVTTTGWSQHDNLHERATQLSRFFGPSRASVLQANITINDKACVKYLRGVGSQSASGEAGKASVRTFSRARVYNDLERVPALGEFWQAIGEAHQIASDK